MKCTFCETELTEEEIELIAEADGMTVDELVKAVKHGKVELLCDKCAEGG